MHEVNCNGARPMGNLVHALGNLPRAVVAVFLCS
jgi:hypothetical protein